MNAILAFLKTIGKWILPFLLEFFWKKASGLVSKLIAYFQEKKRRQEEAKKLEEEVKKNLENLEKAETVEERKDAHEDILNS